MPDAKYVKYGGVRFVNNASPEEINRYVRDLPPEDRESLFEVIKILHDEGLITVLEDEPMTTVDENMLPYLE
ncbi:MAG: hypothetical protein GX182_02275 [Firmicutes bacterium]|nr:hypothetical protein [Bacillota bacterium]